MRHPPGVKRCVAPLVAVSFGLVAASPLPVSAAVTPPPAPTYLRTIGGPAHATMYPSGVDTHKGTIYIADTGNDQIAAYRADGTRRWRVGTRGPKQPGSFNNPRDVAYHNGRLYVADTGYNRVQVLNAKTGAWIATWPHQFQSVIGIGAGPNGHGGTVILTADDDANTVAEWTTSGELVAPDRGAGGQGQRPAGRAARCGHRLTRRTSTSPTSRTTAWPSSAPAASGCATGAPRVPPTGSSPGRTASPLTRPITCTWPTRTTSVSRSSRGRAGTWPSGAARRRARPVHAAPEGCGGRRQ